MNSVSISNNCVNDTNLPLKRTTFLNLNKWPESDAEFIKSIMSSKKGNDHQNQEKKDGIYYRQIFLRSYPISKKETVSEKTKKCFDKVKEKIIYRRKKKDVNVNGGHSNRRKCTSRRKVKELSCSAAVDVEDHKNL